MKPLCAAALAAAFALSLCAQNAALLPVPKQQFWYDNASGKPLAGGLIYTCVAGSTCPGTPLATYTDSTGTVQNPNPVVLDSGGFASIWLGASPYKIVAANYAGVVQWTVDNVRNDGFSLKALVGVANGVAELDGNAFVVQSELNYIPASSTGGVNRTVQSKLGDMLSLKDFGPAGNGTTDDTQAVLNAVATAQTNNQTIYVPRGKYLISKSIPFDFSKTGFYCDNAEFIVSSTLTAFSTISGLPYPYVFWPDSSAGYTTTPNARNNNRNVFDGSCHIEGGASGTPIALIAVYLGDASQTYQSMLRLNNLSIDYFTDSFYFGSNVWKLVIDHLFSRQGNIVVPTGLTNFGENMVIENSQIADGQTQVQIGTGEWHILNSSLDNTTLNVDGDAQAFVEHCHFEAPGNPGGTGSYRYVTLNTNAEAMAVISNSVFVFDTPGSNWTEAFLYVDPAVTNKGLFLANNHWSSTGSWYTPTSTDDAQVLIAGNGKVTLEPGWYETWTTPATHYSIGGNRFATLTTNGGFESGNLNGWSTLSVAGSPAITMDTANPKLGTYDALLTSAAGAAMQLSQTFPCRAGQWVMSTVWLNLTFSSGGAGTAWSELLFYDALGNQIGSSQYSAYTASTGGYVADPMNALAPANAASVQVVIGNNGTTGSSYLNVDDLIVNIS